MPPSLPQPISPPALDFDANSFTSMYHHSGTLEKTLIHPTRSFHSLRSDATTLVNPSTPFQPSKSSKQSQNSSVNRGRHLVQHLLSTLLNVYRRIFTIVLLANLVPLIILIARYPSVNLPTLATAASSNLLAAILVRQDFIINAIFRTAWLVPWSAPLHVRRWVARCYCYGGVHSGAAVAGTFWWLVFTAVLTVRCIEEEVWALPVVVVTWSVAVVLLSMLLLALPGVRTRWHDFFEVSHRFLGWAVVVLFWGQILLMTEYVRVRATADTETASTPLSSSPLADETDSFLHVLLQSPSFWNLFLITALLVYPWLYLREWTFTPEVLSSHAIRLRFDEPMHKFSCLSVSTDPLREWHPFATFPSSREAEHEKGQVEGKNVKTQKNSMIISAAGDWTKGIIAHAHELERQKRILSTSTYIARPASTTSRTLQKPRYTQRQQHLRLHVRATPKPGVLSLSCIFPRILLLTTGSGIGPALSSLLSNPPAQFARLIWSARSPLLTYGAELCALVHRVDPDAVVVDTEVEGRLDLVDLAMREVERVGGVEAVFVMGNKGVVEGVVGGLERQGVWAVGPIWDS